MSDIQPAIQVGDTVRVKTTRLLSANLIMMDGIPFAEILDGRVAKVVAIKDDGIGNTAYILEIDNRQVACWSWQVEKLDV